MKERLIVELYEEIVSEHPDEIIIGGHGDLNAKLMFLGEAPGAKEIELGEPFVGQAGKYFDEFLEVLNVKREDVYITNSVKYRPSKTNPKTKRKSNRTPSNKEIESFRPYVYREISIIKPKIIATLGNIPLKAVFENELKIGKIHGKLREVEIHNDHYKLFPLYHPAAVIYRRELKDVYMDDLKGLKREMKYYL